MIGQLAMVATDVSDWLSAGRVTSFADGVAEAVDLPGPLIEVLLLVEDKRFPSHCGVDFLGIIRAMLAKAGHRVCLVEDFDGLRARTENADARPDVIVTDFNMPGGAGAVVLAQLRAQERRHGLPALPIIVLTADSRDAIRRQALLAGADAVIVKPVDPQRLMTTVQSLSKLTFERA